MTEFPAELPTELAADSTEPPTASFRVFFSDGSMTWTREDPSWPELFVNDGRWVLTSAGVIINPLHVIRIIPT